jgi:hypothetical protein
MTKRKTGDKKMQRGTSLRAESYSNKLNTNKGCSKSFDEMEIYFAKKQYTPEEKLWFVVLLTAIDDYLCGVFCSSIIPSKATGHWNAERYIFGSQEGFNSFDELWMYFFPEISPSTTKKQMKLVLESKMARGNAEPEDLLTTILGDATKEKLIEEIETESKIADAVIKTRNQEQEPINAVNESSSGRVGGTATSHSILDQGSVELCLEEPWTELIFRGAIDSGGAEQNGREGVQDQNNKGEIDEKDKGEIDEKDKGD